jgi:hypothetical protein
MTFLQGLLLFALLAMLAYLNDHFGRLRAMGIVEEAPEYRRGRSALDPIGDTLGELTKKEGLWQLLLSPLSMLGKLDAPFAMALAPLSALTRSDMPFSLILSPLTMLSGFGSKKGR